VVAFVFRLNLIRIEFVLRQSVEGAEIQSTSENPIGAASDSAFLGTVDFGLLFGVRVYRRDAGFAAGRRRRRGAGTGR
jgi:hypothetical protein